MLITRPFLREKEVFVNPVTQRSFPAGLTEEKPDLRVVSHEDIRDNYYTIMWVQRGQVPSQVGVPKEPAIFYLSVNCKCVTSSWSLLLP